jgi:hypothetical protein
LLSLQWRDRPGFACNCCGLSFLQELTADLPERSLFVLGKQNPLRKAAVYAITNKYFDYAMLATIVANCVALGMYSHQPGFDETPMAQFLQIADYCFLGVFSLEMLLKVLAMGLVLAPGTYLRSGEFAGTATYCSNIAASGHQQLL